MSAPWPIEAPLDNLDSAKSYFIALRYHDTQGKPHYSFWSCGLNGKETWTSKPGIAIRYVGGDSLRKAILKNNHIELVAIEVPADAAKRWKARKRKI